ncbi:MAG: geranylgeranylglycerol-phosphate geranylgeranyltransferase [Bacteroidales bacterium]
MINVLKLIRYPNLIIIGLAQYLFRYCILFPIMKSEHAEPAMSDLNFALLVLSTILIAAAGYAINDYFDIRSDRINRPDKIIVGRLLSRRIAMLFHTIFSIIAILLGIYISYKVGSFKLGAINIVIAILLWLYSVKYKAYFLVGNIIVSFATAMTIIVVILFDMYALRLDGHMVIWGYVLFAFMISLIREIIKDIEDIEGDKKCGCSTIPVVIGIPKTKIILLILVGVSVVALSYISYLSNMQHLKIIFWYLNIIVIIPFIYMGYIIYISKNKADYGFLSNVAKFIMLAGVLSMTLIFNWF